MGELAKETLIDEIQRLESKRNRLLEQIREAEAWETAAWDSHNAIVDHINAMDKMRKIAHNYWSSSQRDIAYQFGFVADQSNKVMKILNKKRYELLEGEIENLMAEVKELANVLGLEVDELARNNSFFTLPAEELGEDKNHLT